MSKPLKTRKVRVRKGRNMVTVSRESIYFPSQGDPEGLKHAAQKFLEAEETAKLLMVAIARSSISLDVLDLPGTSEVMKKNAEDFTQKTGIGVTYPGTTVVHECVRAIRETREMLDTKIDEDGSIKDPPATDAVPSSVQPNEPRVLVH